ncbi:hypothetical protein EYR40_007051 [Pleurotus pulmonarius]|nr:hypothetical protein EYR36_003678 [Pleurotus pulmonarius]KAF4599945.1 hypothetical protein EYR40_007051 [Pleurotus pulmonarius]
MSALATARRIEDLGSVQYPEGIRSPSTELNANPQDSKFKYDRDFLLQFMRICTEKPVKMLPLDAIGLQPPVQTSYSTARGGSSRYSQSYGAVPASHQASTGLSFNQPSGFNKASSVNTFTMGRFAAPGAAKMSSEDGFGISSRSASGPAGMAFGRPAQMQRTASQGGAGPMNKQRMESKRGVDRANSGSQLTHDSTYNEGATAHSSLGLEPVSPLQQSANRWDGKAFAADPDSPEIVARKVQGLLNKLTMEKFDSISDQIIEWANRSEKEKDGRTLIRVIRSVFENATNGATWSEMYARLCRKMMEQISPKVQDDGIKNAEGKPITGGHLFRKYLLNRCQEDFERGWVAKEATAAAAASKALEDKAAKAANDKAKENAKEGESTDEVALYSDEYYAAQKARRQGLGIIKFIGELFKLQMLTERIMHECVKKLLGNVDNPEEEEIESLCKLLSTVGQLLDTPKARAHMDVYFSRMKDLIKSPHVSSRMQFMLQDVIELRERRWVSRNQVAAPTTLAAVHEAAAKEKASAEKEALQKQQLSMSRGGSRRGGERNELTGPDGWTTRPPSKAGDLSQFGKISKPATMNFGPSSVFANKKGIEKKEPISRTGSSSNMFSMLSGNPGVAMSESGASKSSRPPSRKASIDLSQSGAPDGQRRRLNLPRTKPVEEVEAGPSQEGESEEGEEVEAPTMSDADAKKKIDEDVKEFFGVRNLDEAEVYFSGLPSTHHERLVDKLVSKAIESKETDATLVADFFTRAASKSLCSPTSFEEGFFVIAEFLEDIAIDAPKAWDFMALMVKGASLNGDNHGRIASKTTDAANLLRLLSSPKAVVSLSPFKAVPDGQLPPLPPVGPFPSRLSPHEATSSLSPHIPTPLSVDDNGDASSASPSSLAAARPIVNLGSVQYPNGIQGPNLELNINAWGGKFRYDREFLLQFMKICTFRPDSLPPLDAIGIQSYGQALYSEQMTWGGSFRSQKPDAFRPISGFSRRGPITTPLAGAKTSSDNGIRGNSVDPGSQGISGYKDSSASVGPSLGHNIVAPLQQSANRWDRKGGDPVERKVRGLLNKLTKKTFNSVSNQIVVWADEFHDGHDHTQLVQMICETLDDRLWLTRLFARMCEKMQRNMAPTASQAFRESLFQRCMADFKRHWAFEDGMEKNDPKAKRQTLGLLSFIGQLFNLQILKMGWQAIIFCIETLLEEVEERKLEGLCALLAAAGEIINERRCPPPPESRGRIGACFARIENLPLSGNISFRMKFKLKDVLKYREWHCPWIISADDSDEDYSDEVIMVKSSVTKSKSVAPSHKPNIDTFRARTPQEEAWRLKLLQDLLDEVEEHEERGAMDQEEATKKIIHDVDEFFVIRHPDAAASEAYFAELPTMYHQQLVNQLVSRAIEFESDEVSTMMLADLFNRVASKKLCSPLAFEEGFRVFVRSLKDIAIDIPKAWWFMDTIVDGVCWNEGYERQRIVPYQMQKYYLLRESFDN